MNIEQVKQLKESIKTKMLELVSLGKKAQLPDPESAFNTANANLDKQDFDIVVCGEIKQGKSSFINALLGKELLPVADAVATSQVFRISNAPKESFYLVFSDGERVQLKTAEDLKKYGSETVAQQERDPLMIGRQLKWIEVNTPAAFLPPGIHLLDTPGLGALYYSHAEITYRYVDMADGVIFLKCANEPLVDKEIKFLEKVFGITPHVLFIQSKSDMNDEAGRQQMTARNQAILNEKFPQFTEKGRVFEFWPLSSTNLFKSAREEDETMRNFLRESSGYEAVANALSELIFQTSGYSIVASAIGESLRFKERMRLAVENECKLLEATSAEEKQKIQNEMKQKQDTFNNDWGQNGKKYHDLAARISTIISSGEELTREIFSQRGEIASDFLTQIENLPLDNRAIEAYAVELDEELPAAVSSKWRELIYETQGKLCELFGNFRVELDTNVDPGMISVLDADSGKVLTKNGTINTARNMLGGATVGGTLGWIGAAVLAAPTGGWSLLAPIIGTIWGAAAAKKEISTKQAEQNKMRLGQYIATYLHRASSQFLSSQEIGRKSQIAELFGSFKKGTEKAVREIIAKEKASLEIEYERLKQDALCNIEETKKRLEEKKAFLVQLNQVGINVQSLKKQLNN